ncbi:hypothetical protein [Amycolatopsis aidingensis]|uniref:hypothetical protein n=1 Tax=Amycolatopsis aidingensis TaxID=2842453 RepID=UPI001C0C4E09|nr:hypothetical protein [Amycolatopsis aidingensis]
MPAAETLPPPAEWRRPANGWVVATIVSLTVVLVLAPLAVAVHSLGAGRFGTGRYCLAIAVIGGLLVWVGYETRLRRHTATSPITHHPDGGGALEIPYSARIYAGYGLVMGGLTALFGMAVVDSATGGAPGGAYVFGVLALVAGSLPALMALGRFRRGYLRLSPDGLHQRGWTFESYLPWSAVLGVAPRYADCPIIVVVAEEDAPWQRRQVTQLWRPDRLPEVRRKDGKGLVPMIAVPGKFLAVDPTLVYYLLGLYLANPGMRAELATESAVRRAHVLVDR